jgi:hypothetical protein
MRKKDVDYKQIVCSVMFAVMGLVMSTCAHGQRSDREGKFAIFEC